MTSIYVSDPIHPRRPRRPRRRRPAVPRIRADRPCATRTICADVDAVMLRGETFTADMIAASPNLKIIARHGVGSDNVDIAAATEHGVWVTVTPGQNSQAVAEHVFALALALARKVVPAARRHPGRPVGPRPRTSLVGIELSGKTLGLFGLGSIGARVARIAGGFGMDVIVADPYVDAAQVAAVGGRKVDFDELDRHRRRPQPARTPHSGHPPRHRRRRHRPDAARSAAHQHRPRRTHRRSRPRRRAASTATSAGRHWTSSRPRAST